MILEHQKSFLRLKYLHIQISGQDVHIKELIEAYGIAVPSVRVFRRGIMADYRGPYDSAGIAEYLNEDALVNISQPFHFNVF
jgi:hypothetical protein